MQRQIPRRHRLPGDAEIFVIVRRYIKEVLGPRPQTVLPIYMVDTVFDDYKLVQIRATCPDGFNSWVVKAREHQRTKERSDVRGTSVKRTQADTTALSEGGRSD